MSNKDFNTEIFGVPQPETTSPEKKKPPYWLLILLLITLALGGYFVWDKLNASDSETIKESGSGGSTEIESKKTPSGNRNPRNKDSSGDGEPAVKDQEEKNQTETKEKPQKEKVDPENKPLDNILEEPTAKITMELPPDIFLDVLITLKASYQLSDLRWDLGGDGIKEGYEVRHTFIRPGKYKITLSSQQKGTLDTREILVSVGSNALNAKLDNLYRAVRKNSDAAIEPAEVELRTLFENNNTVVQYYARGGPMMREFKLNDFIDDFIVEADAGNKDYSGIKEITVNQKTGKIIKLEFYD